MNKKNTFRFSTCFAALLCLAALPAFAADATPAAKGEFSIRYDEIQIAIADSLVNAGAGDAVQAIINNVPDAVLMQSDTPLDAEISFLEHDPRTQRFEATLSVYDSAHQLIKTHNLTGRYNPMVEVPVLSRRIAAGELITAEAITHAPMPANRLRDTSILDEASLVGMSARRGLREGVPIAVHEIENPRIIKRGENVSLHYRSANLEIQTVAEALEDAALGDIISLRNQTSGHVVRATVKAAGVAEIMQPLMLSQRDVTP